LAIRESVYLVNIWNGQQLCAEQGFGALCSKIRGDWVKTPGRERFTFHGLHAYFAIVLVGRDENPETHATPATTHRVDDGRRVAEIEGSAQCMSPFLIHATILQNAQKKKAALGG
jgi:hypothetical protein